MQDIHKGNHDDKGCDKYCNKYKDWLGQELPDCQFKGNKSEIRKLIRKVRIDANGSVDEVQSLDEEITSLMSSNMVQQVMNLGCDASLIKSALERQILKTGQSFPDANSLALAALNTDVEERPSLDDEIQTLMSSDMVQQVLSVGFDAGLIKSTLELQIMKNGKPFSDPNSLILAVLDTEGEERPSTQMIANLETEDATVRTSFDELTSCNSDLKESFEVAMTNPVDEVEHRRPESPEASRIKHRGPGYGKKSVIAKEQPEEIQCGEEQECANKNKGRCIVL